MYVCVCVCVRVALLRQIYRPKSSKNWSNYFVVVNKVKMPPSWQISSKQGQNACNLADK